MNLQEIITLTKTKNPQAEKMLFLRFAPLVLSLCRRYAHQDTDAQDYMQECFIHTFTNIEKYDEARGSFEGWLRRVCTNRVLQILRKPKNKITMVFPETLPEEGMTESEFKVIPKEVIMNAIQQLPDGYREVFNLSVFEDWSHKEIGQALDIAESTSRSQLTRAKKILKQILQNKMDNRYEKRLA